MTGRRGYTLVELITVMGIALLVLSMIGALYLGVSRAIDVELVRGELLAGAREVLHPLAAEVRQADALSAGAGRLSLLVRGRRIEYVSVPGGVRRRAGGGSRLLGAGGIEVEFRPVGGRGVEVVVHGKRTVRTRAVTLERRVTLARRLP